MERSESLGGEERSLVGEVLDALPDAVVVLDADWRIVALNEAAAVELGRRPEALRDRDVWTVLPGLRGSVFASLLLHARTARERVTWSGYLSPVRRWVEVSALGKGQRLFVTIRAVASSPVRGRSDCDEGEHQRLQLLAEVSESMMSTLDSAASLDRLLELVVPRLADWAVVSLVDDQGGSADPARRHRDAALLPDLVTYLRGRTRGTEDEALLASALLTGEPVHTDAVDPAVVEASLTSDGVREAWRRLDVASFTIVPLRTREETFGALTLVNSSARRPHTDAEIATSVEVARRAALALDNARLYARQLHVAETLQRSLLTDPPQPDGVQLVARYRPAASHLRVGGDWYDSFGQLDGAQLLVIGDVVGHNVQAAAAMGQVRSILRGIAYDRNESPARILGRVEAALAGLDMPTWCTALLARIEPPLPGDDRGPRTLRWSSAGHVPPLLIDSDGSVRLLRRKSDPLLGLGVPAPRHDHETSVRPGQTVLLYTDGLIEQGRAAVDEGLLRLSEAVSRLVDLPLGQLCDQLLGDLVGPRPDDDVALLAVRVD